jgi:DNA-binding beta-propeller fold protein YncE
LSEPKGLAFDSSGNLFVANFGNSTIEEFNSSGHGTVFASSGLSNPYGIAFDPINGDLFVGNNNGTIEKFNPNSNGHGTLFASGLGEAVGLAFDSSGNLYAADYVNCTIDKFSPSGHETVFANLCAGNNPLGLAFDSSGNLYVSLAEGAIEEFNPNGCGSIFATNLCTPWFFATQTTPVPEPSSLALVALGTAAFLGRRRFRRSAQ